MKVQWAIDIFRLFVALFNFMKLIRKGSFTIFVFTYSVPK